MPWCYAESGRKDRLRAKRSRGKEGKGLGERRVLQWRGMKGNIYSNKL